MINGTVNGIKKKLKKEQKYKKTSTAEDDEVVDPSTTKDFEVVETSTNRCIYGILACFCLLLGVSLSFNLILEILISENPTLDNPASELPEPIPSLLTLEKIADSSVERPLAANLPTVKFPIHHAEIWDPRQRIMVAHMHKAGGTTLCEIFKDTGMKYAPKIQNCNEESWEHGPEGPPTCSTLDKNTVKYDFFFVERYISGQLPCPQFFSIMALREPVSRIISIANRHRISAAPYSNHDEDQKYWTEENLMDHTTKPWGDDNAYIRTLLGKNWPAPITQADLELAKQLVLKMDYVVVLERMTADIEELSTILNIPLEMPEKSASNAPWAKPDWLLTDDVKEYFAEVHAFDIELFDFVMQKKNEGYWSLEVV